MEYKRKEEILRQFYEECLQILISFESERKKRLVKMICIESALVLICILYFYNFATVASFLGSINFPWGLIISYLLILGCVIAVLVYPFYVNSGFKIDLKSTLMPQVIKIIGSIHHGTVGRIFSESELKESALFSQFNDIVTDDSFNGELGGVNYKISETKLVLQGDKSSFTSFKGVIVEFDSNKKINAKTTITTANDTDIGNKTPMSMMAYFVLFGPIPFLIMLQPVVVILIIIFVMLILNKIRCANIYNKNNKQVHLEDVKFAKKFKVFSEDEVEARYLVTTAFMERFLNLTTSFGTKKAKCVFYKNKVMFAISTRKNLFEFGSLYKSLDNPKNIEFFNELMSILDMIDYFKLDEKVGL